MNVTAVVVAGGRHGPVDALTPVGGVPMVVRAVRCLLAGGLVDDVVVLHAEDLSEAVARACAGLPVRTRAGTRLALSPLRTHAAQRAGTVAGDAAIAPAPGEVVLVHDAARPLAPPALAAAVVEAVRVGHEVAVPVLPLSDTVKQVDRDGIVHATPDRSGLRVVQTPQAFRATLLAGLHADPLAAAVAHAAAGGAVQTVAGDPMAFPVRTAFDLELAELLVGRTGS